MMTDGKVTRVQCKTDINATEEEYYNMRNGTKNSQEKIDFWLKKRLIDRANEAGTVKLEQDRIFHTCHPWKYDR